MQSNICLIAQRTQIHLCYDYRMHNFIELFQCSRAGQDGFWYIFGIREDQHRRNKYQIIFIAPSICNGSACIVILNYLSCSGFQLLSLRFVIRMSCNKWWEIHHYYILPIMYFMDEIILVVHTMATADEIWMLKRMNACKMSQRDECLFSVLFSFFFTRQPLGSFSDML